MTHARAGTLQRGAVQRFVPKRPHKPSSQALGARTIERQHWREAASVTRAKHYRIVTSNATELP